MKRFALLLLAGLILAGCSTFIPKRVELGQDKVQRFPQPSAKRKEAERQAVLLAAQKAREAEKLAQLDNSAAAKPAGEAATLAESVSVSLGPPLKPWTGEVEALKIKLDRLTADYNALLVKFAEKNDKNEGKKIEGTGWLSVPYFVWTGGALLLVFFGFIALKVVLSLLSVANPGVAVGMKVAQVGGRTVSKAFSELIHGGEAFKQRVQEKLAPEVSEQVLELFREMQERRQSTETQKLIKELTAK